MHEVIAILHDEQHQLLPHTSLAAFACVKNGLVRGTIDTIKWIARNKMQIVSAVSITEAIREGLRTLERSGVSRRPRLEVDR